MHVPSGFFALRTPLLAFDEILTWSEGLEAPAVLDDPSGLDRALAADRTRLRVRLQTAIARAHVREALFVASPDLEASVDLWVRDPESDRGRGIELAIVRYFLRMAGRATPFGLCGGCSVGTIGGATRLVLDARARWKRHTQLDVDCLSTLIRSLTADANVKSALTYRPNSSLYRAAGRYRYMESRGEDRSYYLVAVDETESLRATLARARTGATPEDLIAALIDEDTTREEADDYVGSLIDNQILVPEIAVPVTGTEPIQALIDQFSGSPALSPTATALGQVRTALAGLDAAGLSNPPDRYRAIARVIGDSAANASLARLFHVTMIPTSLHATLGQPVVAEIVRGVELLHRLSRRPLADADDLARFRAAFKARYEERLVPLVEALDAEAGIGFRPSYGTGGTDGEASPLLKGLGGPIEPAPAAQWGPRETLLLQLLSDAQLHHRQEIVLDTSDLDEIGVPDPLPLPDAFALTATVAAESTAAVAAGEFCVLLGDSRGPSGAVLLGRFCHADSCLHGHVTHHLRSEEALRPDAVFAEVAHLPEGRLGNILARPVLRGYEIPYLGRSGAPADRQIDVNDLLIIVQGDRIVLFSTRLGREVVPRLTSAHNFGGRNLALYQFLCRLQSQNTASLGWDWGVFGNAPFLPRVTTGRLVLSRARWRSRPTELRSLGQQRGAARFRAVQRWRAERRLPRFVALAEGDNELPLDLDNVLCVETLVERVKGRDEATLFEVFPPGDRLVASGPDGRYRHELVVPFVRVAPAAEVAVRTPPRPAPDFTRTFPPGSEWLFAKLYCGTATADLVLCDLIAPLVAEALASGAVDCWFFIRYYVSKWHIRLRVHGTKQRMMADVLPALHAATEPMLQDGRLWRLQLDTYEREVERYGGPEGLELSEQLFQADSEAVLDILASLEPGDAGLDERWRLTLRGIDMLLEDLGFDLDAKHAIVQTARARVARAVHADGPLKGQIGDRFREERERLEALLDPARDAESPLAPGIEALRGRSARLAPVIAGLKARDRAGALSVSLPDLAACYIHMHANRLLRSAVRAHELVIYDFLARLYDARIARTKRVRL